MSDVEVTGLRELIADLDKAGSRSVPAVRGVVEHGAVNIKKDWRQRWAGIAHAPALSGAVTYDVAFGLMTVGAEVGPDKEMRQGALANIIEFGTENNAPIPGGLPALDAESPKFERGLADLGERLLS
jgi:hypothetical protein